MSKITETLNNLKSKLKNLEDEVFISSIKNSVPVKERNFNRKLKEKLALIEGIQDINNRVLLDVRGDNYELNINTINSCIIENILSDEIRQIDFTNRKSIFLDFDRGNFPTILSLIYYFNRNNLNIDDFENSNAKYKIYLNKNKNGTGDTRKLLELEICAFFKDSTVINKIEFIE